MIGHIEDGAAADMLAPNSKLDEKEHKRETGLRIGSKQMLIT